MRIGILIWPSRILVVLSVLLIAPSIPMLGFLVLISVATSGNAIEAGKWLTYAHAYGMALLFAAAAFVFVILNAFAVILAFCKPSMYRGRGDKVLGLSVMVLAIIANASLIALLRLFPYDHITGWLR